MSSAPTVKWRPVKPPINIRTQLLIETNWGDFFIPNAGALRFTDTEFQIAPRYRANGWQTHQTMLIGDTRAPGYANALAEEKRAWWK